MLVQALFAGATIKAFDEAVLLRLGRRDAMSLAPGVLTLGKSGVTGQLGAIHHARQPATFGDGAQFADDAPT